MLQNFVMVFGPDRQVVYASPAVLSAAGVSTVGELAGKRPGELLGCAYALDNPGACNTGVECQGCGLHDALTESRNGRSSIRDVRISIRRRDSNEIVELRACVDSVDFNGQPSTFVTAVDVGREKNQIALERIFLHDIMNTAMAIRGLSVLLQKYGPGAASVDDFLVRISNLSSQIVDQIDSHRQITLAELGDLEVTQKRVNSLEFLLDIYATHNRPDVLEGRVLRVGPSNEDTMFESDPTLLSRVVGNMVTNAIEASMPGDEVDIFSRTTPDTIQFCVRNPGCIPDDVRQQLFRRSFSTKGPGRGLGTYSMKLLTERYLGGTLAFTSTVEDGTTFVAEYPR